MKIEVDLNKKVALSVIGIVLVLAMGFVVYAYTSIPNPGHGGDTIKVTVGGQEKTLQEAIDAGDFSSGSGGGGSVSCTPTLESSSLVSGTTYQNTGTSALLVSASSVDPTNGLKNLVGQVSSDNVFDGLEVVAQDMSGDNSGGSISFVVLPNQYYKVSGAVLYSRVWKLC